MASDSQTPIFSWQFFVLIAAALGILITQPGTLPLAPPTGSEKAETGPKAADDAPVYTDSRLWADPFDAPPKPDADPAAAAAAGGRPMNVAAPEVPGSGIARIDSGRICVMPVVVRGDSNSAEAKEMRTRFRIATASGLGADGFVPDNPNHLMWVRLALCGGRTESVPVEWFLRGSLSRVRNAPYEAVLVVWIKDNFLFNYPLEQLQDIRSQLEDQLAGRCLIELHRPDFKVIGPYWSGTLVDILSEDPKVGRGITFYSSSATMADGVLELLAPNRDKGGPVGRARLANPDTGPVLVNLTCTDEQLSEALIRELELRGLRPGSPNSRIAIISDWDTDYGRVLPLTFAAKLRQLTGPETPDCKGPPKPDAEIPIAPDGKGPRDLEAAAYGALRFDDASSWPRQILRAYYLSGVEGTLTADDGKAQKPSDESKTAPGSSSSAISLQRAEGEHQIDYVARLGKILSTRINERNVCGENGKLVAIGVLGADVYDKLLLIQALRPVFRDAVFFTDTLDARFMDPVKAIPYTRNMVVAAPFGFDLFRNFQVGATPFRSSEQTGAFLAVQTAAARIEPRTEYLASQLRQPLRFEIGRTYPVALDVPGAPRPRDEKADLQGPVDKFEGLLHPPQDDYFPSWARARALYLLPAALACVFVALLCVTILFVLKGHVPAFPWRRRRTWAIAGSSAVFLAIIGGVVCFYDGIEPATWLQGVSIWPSEILRVIAFVTGIASLLVCHSKVRKARVELAAQFGIPPQPQGSGPRKPLLARFWDTVRQGHQPVPDYFCTYQQAAQRYNWLPGSHGVLVPALPAPSPAQKQRMPPNEKYVILEALWSDACDRSTVFGRNARTLAMTVFFFLALCCLAGATGLPSVPFRGKFSQGCDLAVVFAASVVLIYLMFWVVDETHICLRFIKKLGRRELTIWPIEAYSHIPHLTPLTDGHDISGAEASSYLDVCFIGKLSQEAVPLIIMPFVVLTLMIIARWSFFANWHWETLILAIFGIDSAVCVLCAVKLRNAAVDAKVRSIGEIARAAAAARAEQLSDKADALESLKALMEQNMDGAYVPWHQQPFVSALLLPFGGTGGLGILEYLLSKS